MRLSLLSDRTPVAGQGVDLLDRRGKSPHDGPLPEPLTQLHVRLAALDIEAERLSRTAYFIRSQPGQLAELTRLRDELRRSRASGTQYQRERHWRSQIMTLRQEGRTALDCNATANASGLHRCWRWMDARAVATVVADWTASAIFPAQGRAERPQYGTES